MTPARARMTASQRRETVLQAALVEFAARGADGASTKDIAQRAGISQPYLFRLFPTKKALFLLLEQIRYEGQSASRNDSSGVSSVTSICAFCNRPE